jgi:molybdopterin synthase sulfur carrier subunit
MVTVFIPAPMRSFSGGRDRVEVEGHNLRQVIDHLDAVCPGIKEQLVQEDDIRPGLAFAVNDELATDGLIERVPEGGRVLILPAVGGGRNKVTSNR